MNSKKLIVVSVVIACIALFFAFGGQNYLTLESIQLHKATLSSYVEAHFILSILLASVIYIFVVSLSLPGASFLSLAVGFIFGRWLGWSILLVAATVGATLVFLLARYLFSEWAKGKLAGFSVVQKIIDQVNQYSINYLLFLRLVPLFPFWLVNLAMAFTTIDTKRYAVGTFIGIMPGSFVFANLGQSLATIDSIDQIFSIEMLIAFGLLGVLMLLPIVLKRVKPEV